MARKYMDCREFPSETNCTITILADSEQELLEAAVQHAVAAHKHSDTPELRAELRNYFKEGTPPPYVEPPEGKMAEYLKQELEDDE
ncbi:MAG: DUF1059 domain-containing protein [Pseudomonadota bacterium]